VERRLQEAACMTSISCYAVAIPAWFVTPDSCGGRGRPVADPETPNCLCAVGRSSLIVRTLRGWPAPGDGGGIVVVGKAMSCAGASKLVRVGAGLATEILFIDNPAWEKPNGLSSWRAFLRDRADPAGDGRPNRGAALGGRHGQVPRPARPPCCGRSRSVARLSIR